ncbi:24710_t:CDS:2, partial [Racocetra persica]
MVKATRNWIKKFNKFCQHYNYITPIKSIEDSSLIEQQLCKFIAQMTKKDGGKYKAKTIKQAIDRINRYISKNRAICDLNLHDKYQFPDLYNILNSKMKDLQEKELGKKKDHKNNQQGIEEENAQCIQLLADQSDTLEPPNQNWRETSIWYLKTHCDLNRVKNFMKDIGQKVKVKLPDNALTNHSGRKTITQILQNVNIPEDPIMNITEHKSSQGVHIYKTINGSQKLDTMKTLINTIEPASNICLMNQESPSVLNEIIRSHVNINITTTQDINIVQ